MPLGFEVHDGGRLHHFGQYDNRNDSVLVGLNPRFVAWEFFMGRHWTPSIVPDSGDQNVYLVMDNLGRLGRIWPEADAEATDLETVITDLRCASSLPRSVILWNSTKAAIGSN